VSVQSVFWRRLAYLGARYGPEPWLRLSPPFFGIAIAAALPKLRRTVRHNLRAVYGRRSRITEELDVARTFASYAGCLAESLASERPRVKRARRRVLDPKLYEILNREGGLILATAHVGAWDAAAPLLTEDLSRPVMIVMRAEADPEARRVHDGVRERSGVRVVHVGGHPLDALPVLHHLRDGGVVAVQLDRVPPGARSIEVPLFAAPFRVPLGPFALSGLAQVPILPLFVRRVGYLDYELSHGDLIQLPPRPSAEELERAARRAALEIERFVRAHPTQWFHFARS
jgi:KDO2-lipid IV(A) lauroyltransferase